MDTHALAQQLDPVIEPLELECLGVEWQPGAGARLRVYIDVRDGARAVDVDDCEAASREISAWLDVEDPIGGAYDLEVSSPGIDRPLFSAAQVARAVGETVQLRLRLTRAGARRLQGQVLAVEGTLIRLRDGAGVEHEVDFADVERARVEPDWAALGLAPAAPPGKQGNKRKRAQRRAGRS